jgi:hypothetical protein
LFGSAGQPSAAALFREDIRSITLLLVPNWPESECSYLEGIIDIILACTGQRLEAVRGVLSENSGLLFV